MYTGKVVGTVVATVKEPGLSGIPLLIVQKIENGKEAGLIVAADATRMAGTEDYVYLIGKKEAARVFEGAMVPADAAIVGFIDEFNEEI
jgi:microcompartment protein CcmK/EutM